METGMEAIRESSELYQGAETMHPRLVVSNLLSHLCRCMFLYELFIFFMLFWSAIHPMCCEWCWFVCFYRSSNSTNIYSFSVAHIKADLQIPASVGTSFWVDAMFVSYACLQRFELILVDWSSPLNPHPS